MPKKKFDESKVAAKLPPKKEVAKKEEVDMEKDVNTIHAPAVDKTKTRTTIDMEPELHKRLEEHLNELGKNGGRFSKKDYIIRLIKQDLGL